MVANINMSRRNLVVLFIISCNILTLSHSKIVKTSPGGCGDWCYEEEKRYSDYQCDVPMNWIDNDCMTGERQSPIDIPSGLVSSSPSDILLSQKYSKPSEFELVNNGHTAAISFVDTTDFIMTGSNFQGSYVISGLHFHWGENNTVFGSEHKVAGKSFTMELHIVHHKTQFVDLNEALASDDPNSVAVLGVFFEIEEHNSDSEALQSIINLLASVQEVEHLSKGVGLKVGDLIPSHSEVFHYNGSLTTPCCNQIVFWTVFKTPLSLSAEQIREFRNLKYHNGHLLQNNYRGPQDLFGRSILLTSTKVQISSDPSTGSYHAPLGHLCVLSLFAALSLNF